ncbi:MULTISPECIES: hypothetical protein [Rhodoplanes]|uniref:hypothetical protein n=1 Tax=Rhodoplanes TaxID=29407 RepID=UPI00101B9F74|nr:hypothetical protein [Rhodoplanes serenus]
MLVNKSLIVKTFHTYEVILSILSCPAGCGESTPNVATIELSILWQEPPLLDQISMMPYAAEPTGGTHAPIELLVAGRQINGSALDRPHMAGGSVAEAAISP